MRFLTFLFIVAALSACTSNATRNNASISFEKFEHHFGNLQYKKGVEYSFRYFNPGKTPLLIFDVKTSCGCTVPEWSHKPIKPGNSGEITIKYDAEYPGMFKKSIEVFYNGKDSPQTLTIEGEVEYPNDLEASIK